MNNWQVCSNRLELNFLDQKDNVTKLFQSFRAAWDQVRLQLSSQGEKMYTEGGHMGTINGIFL